MMPPSLEDLEQLDVEAASLGSFSVGLLERPLLGSDALEHLPIHDSVIKCLLEIADKCRVYYGKTKIDIEPSIVMQSEKNFSELNLDCNIIDGREYMWNISGFARGTIMISVPSENITESFSRIFLHTTAPIVYASMNQLKKGHTLSAVNFALQAAKHKHVIFCLPASNGIEWLDVFASQEMILRLLEWAIKNGSKKQ